MENNELSFAIKCFMKWDNHSFSLYNMVSIIGGGAIEQKNRHEAYVVDICVHRLPFDLNLFEVLKMFKTLGE